MSDTALGTPPADVAPALERPTLGQILRHYGAAFRRQFAGRLSREQLRVMDLLERCRTGELGAVLYRCQACGTTHVQPQSCGNRHCPRCQGHKAQQWLEQQLARRLPCAYFLITFTVPQALRPFIRGQPREAYRAMFAAALATLRKLAQNPRHVGSRRVGGTGVLHTWGRTLCYHPHLHFLVPGGALSEDGQQWLPSRADFFVPVHAASRRFRDLLLERLTAAGLTDDVRQQVAAIDWVVHCQPVGDGRRALRYLAPYVYRVAISNRRLLKCEPGPDGLGRVTFSYRRKGARRWRPMTVTASEFLRRFLQHVLPRGFQKVRHFGFVHPRHRADREWLKMLVTVTLNEIYVLLVAAAPLRVPYRPTCPQCGGPLTCVGFLAASAWPFVSYDTS